jgi:F-type H+-transporting ATPase subunit a
LSIQFLEMIRVLKTFFILLFTLAISSGLIKDNNEFGNGGVETSKTFDAGKMIMHHIGDAYEWHFAEIGKTNISIPLPVILYSRQNGLKIFMSSKFEHGSEAFNGFKIAHEGKFEGKIVETAPEGEEIRPLDLSITKNVTSLFISVILIILIFLSIARKYSENFARSPKGTQSWIEPIIIFVRDDVAKAAIGEEKYKKYLPYLLTIFFFILINNLLGLLPIFPGGANLTGNIATTMILALFTFAITAISGSRDYWVHMVNTPGVPWWLKIPIPLMPIVEIMGVFIKPFVLMIRLFANICAGHIIALGFYSLIFIFGEKSLFAGYGVSVVSIAFTVFMSLLELLVAFIQAYVFTLLSAIYFGMALEHHEPHKQSELLNHIINEGTNESHT